MMLPSQIKRLFLLFLAAISHAYGAEPTLPINTIAKVVTSYGNSLGCEVYLDKKNIVPYTIEDEDVFVVLYSIDLGCSGGSAMSRPAFAVIGRSSYGRRLYVLPKYSSPNQTTIDFPAVTYRIFLKDGQLRFLAKAFADTDALCCPSIPIEGQAIFQNDRWVDGGKK